MSSILDTDNVPIAEQLKDAILGDSPQLVFEILRLVSEKHVLLGYDGGPIDIEPYYTDLPLKEQDKTIISEILGFNIGISFPHLAIYNAAQNHGQNSGTILRHLLQHFFSDERAHNFGCCISLKNMKSMKNDHKEFWYSDPLNFAVQLKADIQTEDDAERLRISKALDWCIEVLLEHCKKKEVLNKKRADANPFLRAIRPIKTASVPLNVKNTWESLLFSESYADVVFEVVSVAVKEGPDASYNDGDGSSSSASSSSSSSTNASITASSTAGSTVITYSKERIYAHKNILASSSEFMRVLLTGPWCENQTDRQGPSVIRPPQSAATIRALLKFIYTGEVDIAAIKADPMEMLDVAAQHGSVDLTSACETEAIRLLSANTVIETLIAAHIHELSVLKEACVKFIKDNAAAMMMSSSFLKLRKTHKSIWKDLKVALGAPDEDEEEDGEDVEEEDAQGDDKDVGESQAGKKRTSLELTDASDAGGLEATGTGTETATANPKRKRGKNGD